MNSTQTNPALEGTAVGQRWRANSSTQLYVNDNYQYGVEIEDRFNNCTRDRGALYSGVLDTTQPVEILEVGTEAEGYVIVRCLQQDGKNAGWIEAMIKPEFFRLHFTPA